MALQGTHTEHYTHGCANCGNPCLEFPYCDACKKHFTNEKKRKKGTTSIREKVFARDGYKCLFQNCKNKDLTFDHVKPRSKGGKNTMDNLQTLCTKHNNKKANTEIDYRVKQKKSSYIEIVQEIARGTVA